MTTAIIIFIACFLIIIVVLIYLIKYKRNKENDVPSSYLMDNALEILESADEL